MARILVVDDRATNREFLSAVLGYAGHDVDEARDGRHALEIAAAKNPDLIISDILMPTMDGIEFTRRLSKHPTLCRVPVIFYTATYRVTEARTIAAECGVTTVIAKPSDPKELLDAVHGELGIAAPELVAEEIMELTGSHRTFAVDRLCTNTIGDLTGLQARIQAAIETDDTPSARAQQLQQISTHVDSSLQRAQGLSMRLAALVELGLDLAAQQDPEGMLDMFCRAGRDIMNAKIATVCIVDELGQITAIATYGLRAEQATNLRRTLRPTAGVFGKVLREGLPIQERLLDRTASALGLPDDHPDIASVLIVPVSSLSRTYGWFFLADHVGANEFSEDDAQLAQTLVAQLVPAYENQLLMDNLNDHAAQLEIEIEQRKRALAELSESEMRFRQLAENVREVFYLIDAATSNMLYVSPMYTEIWERSVESCYHDPRAWLDAVHQDDYDDVARDFDEALRNGKAEMRFRINCSSGIRWIKAQMFPIYDQGGSLRRVAGIAEDITESELQSRRIRRLSRIQAVLSGINSAIVRIRERSALLDEACRIAIDHGDFSVAWLGIFQPDTTRIEFVAYHGRDPSVALEISGALVDESSTRTGLAAESQRSSTHVVCNDIQSLSARGRVLDLALSRGLRSAVALPLLPDRHPSGALVLFSDETGVFDDQEMRLLTELAGDVSFALEYISREERINYLAYYDALTGLPNGNFFQERLAAMIVQNSGTMTALFLLDIDRFTHLNDTLGRHVGDQLLIDAGKRLKDSMGAKGTVGRIASDTFAIAASELPSETDAIHILHEQLLATLTKPFAVDGTTLRISARAGVAVYPSDADDALTLFSNAEAALAESKSTGARYLFYSSELNARVAEDLALEQKLIKAVEREEFVVHYQPKVDSHTGEIVGLEALLRWNSPDKGLIPPNEFIPILESSELILDVGRWVIEQALRDQDQWRQRGLEPPPVAVNVSPLQLQYSDFPAMVLAALEAQGADGQTLELEITENLIMADIEQSIEQLKRLTAQNVTVAVDDFGTGYSSLRYLAKLPVSALKIDRSFIVTMASNADNMALVSSIVSLAHSLDLVVVAEGVDAEEQAKFLRLMNCDIMQGYLFGRPQPAADIQVLLPQRPGA